MIPSPILQLPHTWAPFKTAQFAGRLTSHTPSDRSTGNRKRFKKKDLGPYYFRRFLYTNKKENQRRAVSITPFHREIRSWISIRKSSQDYYVDIDSGHSDLAEYGWREYLSDAENLPNYFLIWLPKHLSECKRDGDVIKLLKDFTFMMMRVKEGH